MDDLNKKLKQWDEAIERRPHDELKSSILDNLDRAQETIAFESHFVIPKKLAYAASLLVVGLLSVLLYSGQSGRGNSEMLLTISQDDLAGIKKINEELKYVFPEGIRAAYRNNGQLIIDTEGADEVNPDKSLLIRYVVVKKSGDSFWEKVGVSDVIAAANNPVVLESDLIHGEVWNHRMDTEVMALENNIQLAVDGHSIKIASFGGQQFNKPQLIKQFEAGDVKYQVYQTVVEI